MEPCVNCGRSFNTDALARHQPICQKVQNKPRKVFDSRRQRIIGTEMEQYYKSSLKAPPSSTPPNPGRQKTLSWRKKHEDFIQTVRMARQFNEVAKSGGPLPAPVPSAPNPDYVQCSYCQRHFEPSTAERHIPFCKQQASKVNKTPGTVDPKAKDSLHKRTHYKPPALKKKATPNSSDCKNRAPPGASIVRQNTNFGDTYTFTKPLYNQEKDTDRRIERSVSSSSSVKQDSKWQASNRKALSGTKDNSSVRATSFSRMSRVPQPSLFDGKSSNGTGGGSSQSQTKTKTHNSASRRLFAALEYSDHSSDEGGGGGGRKSSTDHHDQETYSSSHQERKYVIGGLVGSQSSTEGSNTANSYSKGRSSVSSTSNKDKLDLKHKTGRGLGGGREMFVINEGSIDGFSGNGYSNAITTSSGNGYNNPLTTSSGNGYNNALTSGSGNGYNNPLTSSSGNGFSNAITSSSGSKERLSPPIIDSGEAFVPGDEENYSSYARDKLTSGIAVYKEQITNGSKNRAPFGGLAMAADYNPEVHVSKPVKPVKQVGAFLNEHGLPLSKFCYECGSRFPVPQAKYCCECGTKRI